MSQMDGWSLGAPVRRSLVTPGSAAHGVGRNDK